MALSAQMNTCIVKYIHLSSVDPTRFHTATEYELHKATVQHNTYEEMHEAVFSACPTGYECTEPIALYHEVLWSNGLRVVNAAGEQERVRLERDELHHAIEEGEYDILFRSTSTTPLSICVDVVEKADSDAVPALLS
jgi:hypothetical protein